MLELKKVLLLNSQDPEKYNVTFWADYFNIEPQLLRNIFNYVSFAIEIKNNSEPSKILRFIYR